MIFDTYASSLILEPKLCSPVHGLHETYNTRTLASFAPHSLGRRNSGRPTHSPVLSIGALKIGASGRPSIYQPDADTFELERQLGLMLINHVSLLVGEMYSLDEVEAGWWPLLHSSNGRSSNNSSNSSTRISFHFIRYAGRYCLMFIQHRPSTILRTYVSILGYGL